MTAPSPGPMVFLVLLAGGTAAAALGTLMSGRVTSA
jgi:hypothetical protein